MDDRTDVVIQHLKYWKNDERKITSYLKKEIRIKRKKNIFTCPICKKEADDGTGQCSSCLTWFHLNTCLVKNTMPFPIDKKKSWYCDKCINFSM